MSNEHGNVWSELSEMPGVKGLPFPWPVGAAVRLGLHASLRRFYRVVPSPETVAELRASTATSSSCDTPPASVVLVLSKATMLKPLRDTQIRPAGFMRLAFRYRRSSVSPSGP